MRMYSIDITAKGNILDQPIVEDLDGANDSVLQVADKYFGNYYRDIEGGNAKDFRIQYMIGRHSQTDRP